MEEDRRMSSAKHALAVTLGIPASALLGVGPAVRIMAREDFNYEIGRVT